MLEISKQKLSTMSYEELRQLSEDVNEFLDKKMTERQKELWSKVITAIQTYESEIGDIKLYDSDTKRSYEALPNSSVEHPGWLSISEI